MSLSSLVILAASFFEILCWGNRQTDRQTDKRINAAEHPTYATVVGVGTSRPRHAYHQISCKRSKGVRRSLCLWIRHRWSCSVCIHHSN